MKSNEKISVYKNKKKFTIEVFVKTVKLCSRNGLSQSTNSRKIKLWALNTNSMDMKYNRHKLIFFFNWSYRIK